MKLSRMATIISVLGIAGMAVFASLMPLRATAQEEFSASLSPAAGLVQYQARGTSAWVTVRDTQLVRPGDQVRTGSDGLAKLSVVTGIEVDLFPTTVIELNSLNMAPEEGQTFSLLHLVGTIFANVNRAVRETDRVQVILPAAGVVVRGTQFWTFVHPELRAAVLSQENAVSVRSGDGGTFEVTPENFVYITLTLPRPVPAVCSEVFLLNNARATLVLVPVAGNSGRETAVRAFLDDFLTGNVNPAVRGFLREVLGLTAVDLESLTAAQDEEELNSLRAAVKTLDLSQVDLNDLLNRYRSYWAGTYRNSLSNAVAPATCGNGRQDEGETAQNCPTDFNEAAACGNNLCETNRRGLAESVVNCPADCFGRGTLARSCAAAIATQLGGPGFTPVPPRGTPVRPPRGTPPGIPPGPPTAVPPVGIVTPTPSL